PNVRNACGIAIVTLEARSGLEEMFADEVAFDALAQCEGEPIFAAFLRWHLARQMQMQGRVREAIALLSEHLRSVEATGYPFVIAQYHALLAELSMENGALSAARVHSGKTLA